VRSHRTSCKSRSRTPIKYSSPSSPSAEIACGALCRTSGFAFFGRHLQQKLGIDYLQTNDLEIAGGVMTGRVKGEIVNAQRKAQILQEIAGQENISLQQTIAVGDGANDLPMLAAAGLGIAFHAKPVVAQSAKHKISTLGLDSILYLIGVRDRDLVEG